MSLPSNNPAQHHRLRRVRRTRTASLRFHTHRQPTFDYGLVAMAESHHHQQAPDESHRRTSSHPRHPDEAPPIICEKPNMPVQCLFVGAVGGGFYANRALFAESSRQRQSAGPQDQSGPEVAGCSESRTRLLKVDGPASLPGRSVAAGGHRLVSSGILQCGERGGLSARRGPPPPA